MSFLIISLFLNTAYALGSGPCGNLKSDEWCINTQPTQEEVVNYGCPGVPDHAIWISNFGTNCYSPEMHDHNIKELQLERAE